MRRNFIFGRKGGIAAAFLAALLLAACSGGGAGGSVDIDDPRPPISETKTFTVTFHANAPEGTVASGTMKPQTFTEGTAQSLTKNAFSIEGYKFIGWATDKSATEAKHTDGQSITVSTDITLYALWEEEDDPNAPKTIPKLLKEMISDYDAIAARLEDGTTITEFTIIVVADVFYDLPETTTAADIQSIIDKALQEGGDKAEIETALVAQSEGKILAEKPAKNGRAYGFFTYIPMKGQGVFHLLSVAIDNTNNLIDMNDATLTM